MLKQINKNKTKFLIFIFISLSFILNLSKSYSLISIYDDYKIREGDGLLEHKFIKSDIHSIWNSASKLLEDKKNQKNFINSGREYTRTYLPAIIVFNYFKFIGEEIKENSEDQNKYVAGIKYKLKNKKFGLLVLQNIFFIFSLFYFYNKNKKNFDERILLVLIFFLCFEPTLSQWHSNFFTESIFISLFIIFLSLMINIKKNRLSFFFLGLFVGILYMQKNLGFYLIIPVIIIIFFLFKNDSKKYLFFLILGYLIPVLFIGIHNKYRSDNFYITSKHMKIAPYSYLQHRLVANKLNISETESLKIVKQKEQTWILKNKINLNVEEDRLKFYKFKQNEFILESFKNPLYLSKIVIWKTLQSGILDLHYSKTFFTIDKTKKNYWKSDEYKKNLYIKILYSSIIYLISLVGFFVIYRTKKKLLFVLSIIIVFITLVLGWTGVSRYFIINLVPISILFSHGIIFLKDKILPKSY